MKRITALILCAFMALSVSACGSTEQTKTVSPAESGTSTESAAESGVATATPTESTEADAVQVFEDEQITVDYLYTDSDGVHFEVVNSMDDEIFLLFDTITLNGKSYDLSSGDYGSTDIAAQSTGEVVQYILEDYDTDVTTIGGTFRYAPENQDDNNYVEYSGDFANVDVTESE